MEDAELTCRHLHFYNMSRLNALKMGRVEATRLSKVVHFFFAF